MRESKVEKAVSKFAWHHGIANYKFRSPGNLGVPDRIFISKLMTFFIEFKAPGETLGPAQVLRIKEMRESGAKIVVIDDTDTGVSFIDRVLDKNTGFYDET